MRSCVIIISRRGGVYIYHTEIYNCIVVGQLSGYSKYFYFVFPLVSCCTPLHTHTLVEKELEWVRWRRGERSIIPRNKRSRKRNKNNKLREFLLETSSDVGLFMNELSSTRKLNRHSGGIRLQFFSVLYSNNNIGG